MNLTEISNIVHNLAKEKGWHEDQETELQYIQRCVANIHGEVSELWESVRNGKANEPSDKQIWYEKSKSPDGQESYTYMTNIEEELADIIIRSLDMAARLQIDIHRAVACKHGYNKERPHRHGGKLA